MLDIVGGAGYQRCCGKLFDLRVGVVHDGGEHLAAQIAANGSRHAGCDEAYRHRGGNHQQGQAQHLPANAQQIRYLHVVSDALGFVFEGNQQHGLAGKVVGHGPIQLGEGPGMLVF